MQLKPIYNQNCLLVHGMHRSGTSAFSGLLNQLGIPMGAVLKKAAFDNPKGFFENELAVQLNEEILGVLGQKWDSLQQLPKNWKTSKALEPIKPKIKAFLKKEFDKQPLFAIKDPRFSLTFPFWQPIFEELNIQIQNYILIRHPYEVAASLFKRNAFSKEKAMSLWVKYNLNALEVFQTSSHQLIPYDTLIKQPNNLIPLLKGSLNGTLENFDKVAEQFIEPRLRNHRETQPILEKEIQKIYSQICQIANSNERVELPIYQGFVDTETYNKAIAQEIQLQEGLALLKQNSAQAKEKKATFWWSFIQTIVKYPKNFWKQLNLENFRTLRKALTNEPPALILRNLKNLLMGDGAQNAHPLAPASGENEQLTLNYQPNGKAGTILYITHNLPDFDTSSGGKRASRLLKLLAEDFEVVVFCLGDKNPKYKNNLNESDIHVVKTTDYKLLKQEIPRLKTIICSAFVTVVEGNQIAQWYPEAKLIVDTVDVHWIREERSIGLEGGLSAAKVAQNKAREIAAYQKVDLIWTVTEEDKFAILKEIPEARMAIVSNIHEVVIQEYQPTPKVNLLFFGSYRHHPNIPAVKHLAMEIFPKVRAELPSITLTIAGAHAPKEVEDLGQLPGVIFRGFVEETDLKELYAQATLSVSPLFSGAGIKGKICEAIAYRTPIVTNKIGNEGIKLEHGKEGFIAEIPDMASVIIAALNRTTDFEQITIEAQQKLAKIVGPTKVKQNMLTSIFPMVSICIVTWNRLDLLKKCLTSIERNTHYPNYKILIHSNGCEDGTADYLTQLANKNSKIIPILSPHNEVFVLPNNKMMRHFPESDVVLVNNDVTVANNWLLELHKAAYLSNDIGVAGAKILFPNGKLQEFGAELYADGSGNNIGRLEDPKLEPYNKIKETGYVSGCMMYIKRSTIEKIGVFDEQFHPCYYEDSDYCYTAKEQGVRTIVTPYSVAYHEEGSTSGTDTATGYKQYQQVNIQKFLKKHRGKNNGINWFSDLGNPANLSMHFVKDFETYTAYKTANESVFQHRQYFLQQVITHNRFEGINPMLDKKGKETYKINTFSDGPLNIRENFIGSKTQSNCRLRASYLVIDHFLQQLEEPEPSVYFTESTTPFYQFFQKKLKNVVGSEYLGPTTALGATNSRGIRNEDLTQLTFESDSFDMVVCLEVLEHVPDYPKALAEVHRVLKPNGIFIFSVPFILDNSETTVRAKVNQDGTIEHILPPEYHGDPVNPDGGILCYYHFGWDLLEETLQKNGFETSACLNWSSEYAIFGNEGKEVALFYAIKR